MVIAAVYRRAGQHGAKRVRGGNLHFLITFGSVSKVKLYRESRSMDGAILES